MTVLFWVGLIVSGLLSATAFLGFIKATYDFQIGESILYLVISIGAGVGAYACAIQIWP